MSALDIATSLAKKFEGCKLQAYWDETGKCWTIGFGVTGREINSQTVWTQYQAESALADRMQSAINSALSLSPCLKSESEQRLAAISDFIYNCGAGNYQTSTLRTLVNQERWTDAKIEILKWNKSGGKILDGLMRRREAESDLL